MEEIFGQNGLIAQAHPDYEYREGQVAMADAVLKAFEENRHLIVEAGTGTGKTLAYLVPAIAAATQRKQRIIISTGTKNLQEQLMEKDVPFLQRILPKKFTATYMKGRSNYACLQKVKKAETLPILQGLEDIDYFQDVSGWTRESTTGDKAELMHLPENLSFWRQIDARSDSCIGQKCPDYDACFITRMRQRGQNADIIIVNHHLFFADLNLRGNDFGSVLPDYSAVIFDEAHLIEDVASEYFGFQTSSYQIEDLSRDLSNLAIADVDANRELTKITGRVLRFADSFWTSFKEGRGEEGRFPILPGAFARKNQRGEIEATPLGDVYLSLDNSLGRMETTLDALKEQSVEIEALVRRVRQIRFDLEFIVAGDDKRYVYWLERRGRGLFLRASPIDVSSLLQDKLFEKVETVVLTSATLTSANSFNFIRDRLGLNSEESFEDKPPLIEKTDELLAASSFDYKSQAIIYLPPRMPEPRDRDFNQRAAEEIIKLLNVTKGRAFVLSTSFSSMNALFELVAFEINYPCFLQGTASKAGLIEKFRTTPNAVLFATSSFWQGVDVRGEQLSCVIIDKLPFAVPSDPIIAARTRYIDDNGGSSFYEYSIPQAIITLKQGIGRLIRSTTDKGVLSILDPRVRTKGYGKKFLESLPPCRITTNINDIAGVFETSEAARR